MLLDNFLNYPIAERNCMKNKLIERWNKDDSWILRKVEIIEWILGEKSDLNKLNSYHSTPEGKLDFRGFSISPGFNSVSTANQMLENKVHRAGTVENIIFENIDFSYANFENILFSKCKFIQCIFAHSRMISIHEEQCEFSNCTFKKGAISGWLGMGESIYRNVSFDSVKLVGINMSWPNFEKCQFVNCDLKRTDFGGSHFDGVKFIGKVEDVWFRGILKADEKNNRYWKSSYERWNTIKPMKVDFSDATLTYIDFSDYCDLSEVVLPKDGSCYLIQDVAVMRDCLENYKVAEKEINIVLLDILLKYHLIKRAGEKMSILSLNDLNEQIKENILPEEQESAIKSWSTICEDLLKKDILKVQ